jgi:hypothetical protein
MVYKQIFGVVFEGLGNEASDKCHGLLVFKGQFGKSHCHNVYFVVIWYCTHFVRCTIKNLATLHRMLRKVSDSGISIFHKLA